METDNIYQIDCIEGLSQIADNGVDIVITSPPYNLSKTGIIQRNSHGKVVKKKAYDGYADNLTEEEYYKWISAVIKECIRVTKYYVFFNFQLLRFNKKAYLQILADFKNNIKDIIIWHKYPTQPAIQNNCLSSAFEFVVVFAKKEYAENRSFERCFFDNRVKGKWAKNVIYERSACIESMGVEHNAVFPIPFVKWFLKLFTDKGDIVLDPFMGTGTTAQACYEMDRRYVGFEIIPSYIELAKKKLRQKSVSDFCPEGTHNRNYAIPLTSFATSKPSLRDGFA